MVILSRAKSWLWIVPLLLLVAGLALPRLDMDGLWYDEIWSLRNAGGAQYGALSPVGIWNQVAFNDPHQSFGYPYLLAIWGHFVGWSEFAGRLLSLFAGLLSVAVTYRLGSEINLPSLNPSPLRKEELESPPTQWGDGRGEQRPTQWGDGATSLQRTGFDVGARHVVPENAKALFSALILGTSAFFLYYTHELRAFTLVALCAAFLLLGYLRLLRHARLRWHNAAFFVMGGVGLLYTHYFAAATLLGALGLYHLLFARKNRRWLKIVGLALVIGLLFLPEVPAFLRGFTRFSPEDVNKVPLTALEALQSFAHYLGNGAVSFIALLLVLGVIHAWRSRSQLRVIISMTLLAVLLTLAANAVLGILEPQRLRYTIVLWPGLALWAGAGFALLLDWLHKTTQKPWLRRVMLVALPGLWLLNALLVSADTDFTLPLHGDRVVRWRTMTNIMQDQGGAGDLFAFYAGTATQAYPITSSFEHSTHDLPFPALITSTATDPVSAENRAWAAERIAAAQRVWLGIDHVLPITDEFVDFQQSLEEDFIHCGNFVSNDALSLELYARSEIFCPSESTAVTYADGLRLLQYALQTDNDALIVEMLWQIPADFPPETYNLALHLTPPDDPTPITQADLPLPAGHITPLMAVLDLATVPPGTYTLYAIVYNWQTSIRLPGTQNETTSERVLLGEVNIP